MGDTDVLESSDVYREIYEVVSKIGEGGFGKVFSVKNKTNNETFAAKCIRTRLSRDKIKPKQEIALLKSLDNDFIIKFVDAFEGPAEIILVTEYLGGGELFERIVDDSFELLESDCCFFMRQVCRGLDYLHRNSIVHLDIKVGFTQKQLS
jgi:serine/threonine protein kinase